MTDTCDLETCGKETGLKEGVCILHIANRENWEFSMPRKLVSFRGKEEMPTDKSGITELGRTSYIDSASEVYSFCDLDCLKEWLINKKLCDAKQ